MTTESAEPLCDPVLIGLGIEHGFGQCGAQVPENIAFPIQVHGTTVHRVESIDRTAHTQADVVMTDQTGLGIGIVTADCVPILLSAADGSVVAAIHAGWRGLAAGVIESGLQAVRASTKRLPLFAAVGPAARGCCYEVDEPVRRALLELYSEELEGVLVPGASDRFQLDLAELATRVLIKNGLERPQVGIEHRVCTICSGPQFESFRRDGQGAGRGRHYIFRRPEQSDQG